MTTFESSPNSIAFYLALLAENKRLKDHAEHKDRALVEAAHDLRAPVASILFFAELLEEELNGRLSTEHSELLSHIRASGELLLKVLEDLLESPPDCPSLSLEPVDLRSLVDECLLFQRPLAEQKGVRLEFECNEWLPCVKVDRLKVMRIIIELLNNAVRHSNSGRSVELRLTARAAFVEIAVRDQGPGFSAESLRRILRPFPGEGGLVRRKGEARIGRGLEIVKKIIEAHAGRFRVESQPGKGSTIFVLLPVYKENEKGKKAVASEEYVGTEGRAV